MLSMVSLFLQKRFPFSLDPRGREVIRAVREANKKLEHELGGGYHGVIILGSRTLGYAREDSDIDLKIVIDEDKLSRGVLRKSKEHVSPDMAVTQRMEEEIQRHGFKAEVQTVDPDKDHIRNRSLSQRALIDEVADYFGLTAGKQMNIVRLRLLRNLQHRDDGEEVWEKIRAAYAKRILSPAFHQGRQERFDEAIKHSDYRVFPDQVRLIRSKKFGLPPLQETIEILSSRTGRTPRKKLRFIHWIDRLRQRIRSPP